MPSIQTRLYTDAIFGVQPLYYSLLHIPSAQPEPSRQMICALFGLSA
jgi:hypothetical protein